MAKKTAKSRSKKSKNMSARTQWGLVIVIPALIVGALIFNGVRDAADDGGAGVVTSSAFDLPNRQNEDDPTDRIRIADFRGKPTVVNFFASWCTTCDEELPVFRDAALALEGEVNFVFVNSNENGNWKGMAERNEILQFPIAEDIQGNRRNGLYRSLGGTEGMPITAFYGADGDLIDVAFVPFNESQLDTTLRQLQFIS